MLTDLLIIALAAAFVVSFAERWLDHPLIRGGIALLISSIGTSTFGYFSDSLWRGVFFAWASAFAALMAILAGERLATPPAMVVDSRRR